ncbi:MAG: hypothetical protein RSC06_15815 [Clostridia bacterium]
MMWIPVIVLLLLLVLAVSKWVAYYAAVRGLLYYLATEHNDLLSEEKTREIIDRATERMTKEITGKR